MKKKISMETNDCRSSHYDSVAVGEDTHLSVMAAGEDYQGISLKEIYKNEFLVGNIYNPSDQISQKKDILLRHFNVVTPENLFKPDAMQREKGNFVYQYADDMMEFCEENNLQVAGHTFAWNQQTPSWMYKTNTREEATKL